MQESDLNRIIKSNINLQSGWAEKIADSATPMAMVQNPFDGFFYTKEFNGCFESKLIKEWKSFNFSQIRPHQVSNLTKIKEICKNQQTPMLTVVILGVWIPRCDIELFIFDISLINSLLSKGKMSILKKELEKLSKEDKSIKMSHKEFNIKLLKEKVIHEL